MTIKFERLDHPTTPEGVYRVLRKAILDGSLPAGSQLRETGIASDLGVSRAPLREALTRLEEEGLVGKIPFRGAFVSEVSPVTIAEIASLRFLIEPYAAGLAAERLRGSDRKVLAESVIAIKEASALGDIPASIDAHLQFHRLFYECSGNGTLLNMWNGWESKLRLFLAADHRLFGDLNDLVTEHELLAELALTGDIEEIRRALSHHVHNAVGSSLDEQVGMTIGANQQDTGKT